MPTKVEIQIVIALILCIVASVGLTMFTTHYMKLKSEAEQGANRGQVISATNAIAPVADKTDEARATEDVGVKSANVEFHATIDEAKRNEPATATRADGAVPVSVRNAFRARRLARQRLGNSESVDASRAGTEDTPER